MASPAIDLPLSQLECVETSFAKLYRTPRDVFKVRKPVRMRMGSTEIDLSTIDARRRACLEEASVDRRLAPEATFGVVALTRGASGEVRIGGDGELIDWALHLRRLRDEDRGDYRLAAGRLEEDHLRSVAHRLAAFHERAKGPLAASPAEVMERLREGIDLVVAPCEPAPSTPLPASASEIATWQTAFLEAHTDRFLERAATASIREGHGELALDHLFLDDEDELQILAGLEAAPGLRHADVTADVALLMADLASRHRVDLAERFVAEYAGLTNDFDLYPLLDFYASLRASQRGKIDWYVADRDVRDSTRAERIRRRASRWFALALSASARPLLPPVVVAMGGQVASGKSTVARHIANRIGAPVVGSDSTRDFLLGARLNLELHEANWAESYEPGFGAQVYEEILRRAEAVLDSGRPVVIDGCFRSRADRARARELAERFDHPFLFVEATVSEEVQLARLAERAQRDSVSIDAWKEIADQLRDQWESAEDLAAQQHLCLDTALPLEQNADVIEARLPTWPEDLTG